MEFKDNLIEFRIRCSQGTYVRSLGEDMAERLGTAGHLVTLTRLASTPFTCQEAVDLEQAKAWTPEELEGFLMEPSEALARCGLPAVSLDEDNVWQLRQGCILQKDMLSTGGEDHKKGAFRVLSPGGELVAVLRWLNPAEARPGRYYETIRVFPERP